MNLIQAVQWVESELVLDSALEKIETGEVRRRLLLEHDIIARELRIPTKLVVIEDPSENFSLPISARDTGLLAAHEQDSGLSIPIYDLSEVAAKYPRWREDTFEIKLLVWDPTNITSPVIPKGFDSDESILLTVVLKPTTPTEDTDEFWNGIHSEFHDLIPRKVAGDLLIRGSEVSARAGGVMLGQVRADMSKAFARVAHPVFFGQGPREIQYE